MGEKVRGLRSTNRQLKKSHGDVKYGIGNGVAKELTHMSMDVNNDVGIASRNGGCWVEEGKARKTGTTVTAQ